MPDFPQDLHDVWILLPWPYFIGLAIARQRYQLPVDLVDFAWIVYIAGILVAQLT